MPQDNKEPISEHQQEPSYIPASPVKRTLAWIGLSYALIIVALMTYIFYTGTALGNLAPILTIPALVGGGILALVSWKTTGNPTKWVAIGAAAACWIFAAATLPLGLVGLMSNFGG